MPKIIDELAKSDEQRTVRKILLPDEEAEIEPVPW